MQHKYINRKALLACCCLFRRKNNYREGEKKPSMMVEPNPGWLLRAAAAEPRRRHARWRHAGGWAPAPEARWGHHARRHTRRHAPAHSRGRHAHAGRWAPHAGRRLHQPRGRHPRGRAAASTGHLRPRRDLRAAKQNPKNKPNGEGGFVSALVGRTKLAGKSQVHEQSGVEIRL